MSGAPNSHDEHDLNLLSDSIRDIAPAAALDLNPGQIVLSEDGWMDPAMEAACSSVVEPNTDSAVKGICITGPLDLCPDVGSEPRAPGPIESDWSRVMQFTAADIFQYSPFGDVLNSLTSLSLTGDSWPNYVRLEWEAGDEGIRCPPTTHFIATVDDLTDVLDFDSEDIDDIDDDAGEEQEPWLTGRWAATPS